MSRLEYVPDGQDTDEDSCAERAARDLLESCFRNWLRRQRKQRKPSLANTAKQVAARVKKAGIDVAGDAGESMLQARSLD
jgi:hypothetical protein